MNAANATGNIYKVVRFDCSVDWEEEDRRTAHGFQSRRDRKERKQMEERNRDNKIEAVVGIIHDRRLSGSLVALARGDTSSPLLAAILNRFHVPANEDIATRLAAFRNMPFNTIHDNRNADVEGIILALYGMTAFFMVRREKMNHTCVVRCS